MSGDILGDNQLIQFALYLALGVTIATDEYYYLTLSASVNFSYSLNIQSFESSELGVGVVQIEISGDPGEFVLDYQLGDFYAGDCCYCYCYWEGNNNNKEDGDYYYCFRELLDRSFQRELVDEDAFEDGVLAVFTLVFIYLDNEGDFKDDQQPYYGEVLDYCIVEDNCADCDVYANDTT
ncbi:MAG: hypothetical protein EZS28_024264 [Streblomastix strix]|uniref:Uncharacterized protein n=1 Tax=Streblomastix strix TaxID=222440 RepID=A0A5J4VCF6_9EUKA|nr:MAG: hypothetical protein EZS28_024264 [Streblomastix strix]